MTSPSNWTTVTMSRSELSRDLEDVEQELASVRREHETSLRAPYEKRVCDEELWRAKTERQRVRIVDLEGEREWLYAQVEAAQRETVE